MSPGVHVSHPSTLSVQYCSITVSRDALAVHTEGGEKKFLHLLHEQRRYSELNKENRNTLVVI